MHYSFEYEITGKAIQGFLPHASQVKPELDEEIWSEIGTNHFDVNAKNCRQHIGKNELRKK